MRSKIWESLFKVVSLHAEKENIMESEFKSEFKARPNIEQYYENGAASDHYNTSYAYDLMGNILSLKRNGLQDDGAVDDTVNGLYYKGAFSYSELDW